MSQIELRNLGGVDDGNMNYNLNMNNPDKEDGSNKDFEALMPTGSRSSDDIKKIEWTSDRVKKATDSQPIKIRSAMLVVVVMLVLLLAMIGGLSIRSTGTWDIAIKKKAFAKEEGYTCTDKVQTSQNTKTVDDFYNDENNYKLMMNMSLAELKGEIYDGWSGNFHERKEQIRAWKELAYVPNVNSGDIIYESACGIGFNLLMTAEILQEYNITNLTIYGNDYVHESVYLANRIWDEQEVVAFTNKGQICNGDSSNLSFVPSDLFDFVYTGYIDPIMNPTMMDIDDDGQCNSLNLCKTDPVQATTEQTVQEDWFASWVSELVRIAKPGKIIAVESISKPVCADRHSWGGVDKKWWNRAISKYDWDVDPTSFVHQKETNHRRRYNVMMRKREAQ